MTPVHDIAVTDSDVVIATHGRSFYVLDDVAVLRQLTPAMSSQAPVHLFTPQDAVRSVSRGVSIDYYLKDAASKVTLDILGADGQLDSVVHGRGRGEDRRRRRRRRRRRTKGRARRSPR